MPEDKKAKKAKRRLLDIEVDEISVVDNPAIDEPFILIKRAENAMGPQIKAAMEAKGMDLDQLAKATAIALEKLKTVVEGTENLSEEELGKVATALDVEKFDPAEKEGEQAPPQEKQEEGEGMEGEGGDDQVAMLHEKLNMLIGLTSEVAAILADMGALQQKSEEDEKPAEETKPEEGAAAVSESTSEHLNPEASVSKAIEKLTAALIKIKNDLAQKGKDDKGDKPVEKGATSEPPQQLDITKHPDVVEMRKQIGELTKKLEGFEKSGITKSLGKDDSTTTATVKKDAGKCEWRFFGDDFKD